MLEQKEKKESCKLLDEVKKQMALGYRQDQATVVAMNILSKKDKEDE